MNRAETGRRGEAAAARWYQKQGAQLLAHNYHTRMGELDLVLREPDGTIVPKIKVSENVDKITNPHFKKVYRIFDKATGKAEADYITVWDEVIEEGQPLELFDPDATWKRRTYTDYTIKPLQEKIFDHGELVYQQPTLPEIQKYCREQIDTLWDEVKRFENPHNYYVDLSQKLWDIKQDLLRKNYR